MARLEAGRCRECGVRTIINKMAHPYEDLCNRCKDVKQIRDEMGHGETADRWVSLFRPDVLIQEELQQAWKEEWMQAAGAVLKANQ